MQKYLLLFLIAFCMPIINVKADTTYIEMLSGKGFKGMPVLQVGDEYFDFMKANKWIGEQ